MHVIGTAGHVDHGKSTLVEALTGTHPDRLKEEREREMTIDLGFAWLTLPGGEEVGIVDVPGHRDFIENMLAGVGGIDAVLFVIASDEGVMPQTREHLAILDILQVQGGVVALTKVDIVEDKEWLDLVEEEVHRVLAGTVLADSPIVRVSARTGEGIPLLLTALQACLANRPPRPDLGRPRLPVDRVFTIAGFGTVATGTLIDGRLQVGDELEVMPQGLHGRVRGLQTHKQKEEYSIPGSRTAVNISGVNVEQIQRGDVLAHPGDYQSTRRLDVRFHLLPDVTQPLQHNMEVKMFIGSAEVVSRLRLLGSESLEPGQEGWLQLELNKPVVAVRGDHYILRRPSPGETLGGGVVVDPHPKGRHKRFTAETLESLEVLSRGTPSELLLQALLGLKAATLQEVISQANIEEEAANLGVDELLNTGQLIILEEKAGANVLSSHTLSSVAPDILVTSKGYWEQLASQAVNEVEVYHRSYPLRRGMPREELKSRLKLPVKSGISARLYSAILHKLVAEGALEETGSLVLLPGHRLHFNPQQETLVDKLLARFKAAPYAPPTIKECQAEVGDDIYQALVDSGRLVPVPPDVVFRQEDYDRMVAEVRSLLAKHGTITAAQVRDHFNTSRRYVLALLEHLDTLGVTVREGDVRRLKVVER